MVSLRVTILLTLLLIIGQPTRGTEMADIYSFKVMTIDGEEIQLADYRGKVMLIVNVASKCGFTSQYDGLEKLYQQYSARGLTVLGFPCNQFGNQEPGTNQQIKKFCRLNYGVSFPMFAKIEVNGSGTHPLYAFLKGEIPGKSEDGRIQWNFTKFLIDRDGKVVNRFGSSVEPSEIAGQIEKLL